MKPDSLRPHSRARADKGLLAFLIDVWRRVLNRPFKLLGANGSAAELEILGQNS
jgi:hypothetical protein